MDWQKIAVSPAFRKLLKAKAYFIVPACLFFIVYYFALPLLVGYAPQLMEKEIWGHVNLAYLFALSQFFMAWLLAALYLSAAGHFDRLAEALVAGFLKFHPKRK